MVVNVSGDVGESLLVGTESNPCNNYDQVRTRRENVLPVFLFFL